MPTDTAPAETIHITTFSAGKYLIGLAASKKGLVRIAVTSPTARAFRADIARRHPGAPIIESASKLKDARRQIEEYFAGTRRRFDLELDLRVTPFQRRVLQATRKIPYGKTAGYGEIARRIGSPRAARAVGGALHNNPLAIVIPCHRVIGADGSLVGFGGGLKMKEFFLDLERV